MWLLVHYIVSNEWNEQRVQLISYHILTPRSIRGSRALASDQVRGKGLRFYGFCLPIGIFNADPDSALFWPMVLINAYVKEACVIDGAGAVFEQKVKKRHEFFQISVLKVLNHWLKLIKFGWLKGWPSGYAFLEFRLSQIYQLCDVFLENGRMLYPRVLWWEA